MSKAKIPSPVNLEEIQRRTLAELPPPPSPLKLKFMSDWEELNEPYKDLIKSYKIKFLDSASYYIDLEFAKKEIINKFKELWRISKNPAKFNIIYICDFTNIRTDEIAKESFGSHRNLGITAENQIETQIERAINNILNSLRGIRENTEWVWYRSNYIILRLFRYKRGTLAASGTIRRVKLKLPKWVEDKQSCIKIENDDDKCFLWCILRALHPVKEHSYRISDLKEFVNELDTSMLEFPVDSIDSYKLNKFEVVNKIRLNIFQIGKKYEEVYGNLYQ
jgi:hypothetical protein